LGHRALIGHGPEVGPDRAERFRADSADAHEVSVIAEWAIGATRIDDSLGERLADFRQLQQFGPIRGVDVDLKPRRLPLGPLKLNHVSSKAAAEDAPCDCGSESEEDERCHGELVGSPEKPSGLVCAAMLGIQWHSASAPLAVFVARALAR
jgi:hypothetical protein